MNIAIIPARGGSKRIPRKNALSFCGEPIISYSIKAALEADVIEKVIVSTDDFEIAEIATEWGAEVPFIRNKALADDMTGTTEVIRDAITKYIALGNEVENCLCLYATAPFITHDIIEKAFALFQQGKPDYLFTANQFLFPIQRALLENENGKIRAFDPENIDKRSQDLPHTFHDAGQLYIAHTSTWLDASKEIFSENSQMFKLPSYIVQDIDTPEDWKRAEVMYKVLSEMNHFKKKV